MSTEDYSEPVSSLGLDKKNEGAGSKLWWLDDNSKPGDDYENSISELKGSNWFKKSVKNQLPITELEATEKAEGTIDLKTESSKEASLFEAGRTEDKPEVIAERTSVS